MGVQLANALVHWPAQFGAHLSARFSDGTLLALYFNGGTDSNGNVVYHLSRDNGATWSAAAVAIPLNENAGSYQAHIDLCQSGDVVYGACIRFVGGANKWTPFKLAYAAGMVTATVGGTDTAIPTYASAGANPTQGGCQLSVSHDADHNLMHVGVQLPGGLSVWAVDESSPTLAIKYMLAGGPATTNFNQPIVYVQGVLWTYYDTSVNSVTAGASSYGAWAGATALPAGASAPVHGSSACRDHTQSPAQPAFAGSDAAGVLSVYTYNGSAWTRTAVDSSGTCFGAALASVGLDLWVFYTTLALQGTLRKRQAGVWGAATQVDATGDRGGWPAAAPPTPSTFVLVWFTGGPFNVFAQTYTLVNTPGLLTVGDAAKGSVSVSDAA